METETQKPRHRKVVVHQPINSGSITGLCGHVTANGHTGWLSLSGFDLLASQYAICDDCWGES